MKHACLIGLVSVILMANATALSLAEETHAHHGHELSGPELGLSAGLVHLPHEDENVLGVHGHLLWRLGDEGIRRYFALGFGAEYLFAEEEHYALMFSIAAYPWRGLVLSVSPGVQWAKHDADTESEYSTHVEAAYVFPVGEYDIGPVIDYSWTKDEEHYLIGLHLGIHL